MKKSLSPRKAEAIGHITSMLPLFCEESLHDLCDHLRRCGVSANGGQPEPADVASSRNHTEDERTGRRDSWDDDREYLDDLLDACSESCIRELIARLERDLPAGRRDLARENTDRRRRVDGDAGGAGSDAETCTPDNASPAEPGPGVQRVKLQWNHPKLGKAGDTLIIQRARDSDVIPCITADARRRDLVKRWFVFRIATSNCQTSRQEPPTWKTIKPTKYGYTFVRGYVAVDNLRYVRCTEIKRSAILDIWEFLEVIPAKGRAIEPGFRRALVRCGFEL